MGLVAVVAIGAAGNDDADRRIHGRESYRLAAGFSLVLCITRICTGEVWVRSTFLIAVGAGLHEKRVMHLPRRMAFGEVERGEVEIVGLDIGPFGNREAHVRKDRGDLVDGLGDRVDAAARRRRCLQRQGDIDRLGL